MSLLLFFILISFISINSITDEECLNIAKSCYEKKSLETCHLDNLPEGCHCCYNKFYLNNEPMEICVVASGQYYQQFYNLKPGDVISDNGLTYKSISNTCSKYYNSGKNSGNGKDSGKSSDIDDEDSDVLLNTSSFLRFKILILLLYLY